MNGYLKNNDLILLNASYFNMNLLLIIVCLTLEKVLPGGNTIEMKVLNYLKGVLSALVIYTCPKSTHSLYNYRIIPDKIFLVISSMSITSVIFSESLSNLSFLYTAVFIFIVLSVIYSFAIGYIAKFKKENNNTRLKSHFFWWISFIAFGFVIAFDMLSFVMTLGDGISENFHFLPITYILVCISFLANIRRKAIIKKRSKYKDLSNLGITNRENEVLNLIIKGYKYSEIADKLFISLSTVKKHITSVYKKTNTSNKVELITLISK